MALLPLALLYKLSVAKSENSASQELREKSRSRTLALVFNVNGQLGLNVFVVFDDRHFVFGGEGRWW